MWTVAAVRESRIGRQPFDRREAQEQAFGARHGKSIDEGAIHGGDAPPAVAGHSGPGGDGRADDAGISHRGETAGAACRGDGAARGR